MYVMLRSHNIIPILYEPFMQIVHDIHLVNNFGLHLSPQGRQWTPPSFCITHHTHPGPWAKAIPWIGLPLSGAGITQSVLPSSFFMCTTWSSSSSVICRRFDWAGSARLAESWVLTNRAAFVKYTLQCLNVPAPTGLKAVFNSPFTLPFNSFYSSLCKTPYSSLPSLMLSHDATGPISEHFLAVCDAVEPLQHV